MKGGNGMSKGNSGLFKETAGFRAALGEDVYERIMPNGEKILLFIVSPEKLDIRLKRD